MKLTEQQIKTVVELLNDGISQNDIAGRLGVDRSMISRIKTKNAHILHTNAHKCTKTAFSISGEQNVQKCAKIVKSPFPNSKMEQHDYPYYDLNEYGKMVVNVDGVKFFRKNTPLPPDVLEDLSLVFSEFICKQLKTYSNANFFLELKEAMEPGGIYHNWNNATTDDEDFKEYILAIKYLRYIGILPENGKANTFYK